MQARRRCTLAVLLILGSVAIIPSLAFSQRYPERPIQLIIPYVAGATGDITARMLTDELEKIIGQKIIPNNKPGAGTVLGAETAIRAKKDGYTLFYGGASPFVYAPLSNPEVVHYDPAKDVEPLGFHYFFPTVVGVKADAPWKTFPEFVDFAKKNPGKIRITSIGVGSSTHFAIEMLQSIVGIKLTHVPFEGGETVITAVLGGHVEATLDGFGKLKPHVEAGRMRILLVDPKKPTLPEIPTLKELGYKQGLPATWFALWAPAGIPEEARKVLVPAVEKAVKATKPKIDALGSICEYKSPEELRKLRDEEYKQMYEIAVKMGLRKP
ncbi:MAG TPA: tripartite tricarboxylate transporter substrate binding protein [Thermodesulfobacteriota bacterium]|nr:tripartite tricarboxylate transporter substrate binding protein [Thermodesulfobacteriota bacterium]